MSFPVGANRNFAVTDQKTPGFPWNGKVTVEPGATTVINFPLLINSFFLNNLDVGGGSGTIGGGGLNFTGDSSFQSIEIREVAPDQIGLTVVDLQAANPDSLIFVISGDITSLTLQDIIDQLEADPNWSSTGLDLSADDPTGSFVFPTGTNTLDLTLSGEFANMRFAFEEADFDSNNSFDFKGNPGIPMQKLAIKKLWMKNEGSRAVDISMLISLSNHSV